jgi:hypothetical protein
MNISAGFAFLPLTYVVRGAAKKKPSANPVRKLCGKKEGEEQQE